MLNSAKNLKSLDELNMSKRAKTYFMGRFNGSLDEIIWYGRNEAYMHACYPESAKKSNKLTLELIRALDEAGYIRHDLNSGSFCVGRVRRIIHDTIDTPASAPSEIGDFCTFVEELVNGRTISHIDYGMGNELYERFKNPTEEELEDARQCLKKRLFEEEYRIMAYELGLMDGEAHTSDEASKHFRVTRKFVDIIETKAYHRLSIKTRITDIMQSMGYPDFDIDSLDDVDLS